MKKFTIILICLWCMAFSTAPPSLFVITGSAYSGSDQTKYYEIDALSFSGIDHVEWTIKTDDNSAFVTLGTATNSANNFQIAADFSNLPVSYVNRITLVAKMYDAQNVLVDTTPEFDVTITVTSLPHPTPNPSQNVNEVVTYAPREPLAGDLSTRGYTQVEKSIGYLDGLGRVNQTIIQQASPEDKDVVQIYEYDGYGRQVRSYLPYAYGTNGAYKANAATEIDNFYTNTSGIANTPDYYWSETQLEYSPSGKVISQGRPGSDYALGSGHTPTYEYGLNTATDNVLQWTIDANGNPTTGTYYGNQKLKWVAVTDPDNLYKAIEFVDFKNRVVLKRIINLNNTNEVAETYYLYGAKEEQLFQIPPQAMKVMKDDGNNWSLASNEDFQDTWIFQNRYDEIGRIVETKAPGADWIYNIYDPKNQLILAQDGNQRAKNQWIYRKHDEFGRLVVTGLWEPNAEYSRSGMQLLVDDWYSTEGNQSFASSPSSLIEIRYGTEIELSEYLGEELIHGDQSVTLTSGFHFDSNFGELHISAGGQVPSVNSANSFPPGDGSLGYSAPLHITYYDNYDFLLDVNWDKELPSNTFERQGHYSRVRGEITGSKTRVLGSAKWLNAVIYYDSEKRILESITENLLGGTDELQTTYLHEIGGLIDEETHFHTDGQGKTTTVLKRIEYDDQDRIVNVFQKINNQPEIQIVQYNYNPIGLASEENYHSTDGGTTWLQSIDFDYTLQGTIKAINGGTVFDDADDKFGVQFKYEDADNAVYGGNIGETQWKNVNQAVQGYSYLYNWQGNLTSADAIPFNNINDNGRDVFASYDLNGNITTMKRYGPGNTTYDDLTYQYIGNQIQSVGDNGNHSIADDIGFVEGTIANGNNQVEYSFDANGNLIEDINRGIQEIKYNPIGKVERVQFSTNRYIQFVYDAGGNRIRKIIQDGNNRMIHDYIMGFHYEDNELRFVKFDLGRLVYNGVDFDYEYFLTDHTGTIRFVIDENGNEIQSNHYYPFGMVWDEGTSGTGSTPINQYLYTGKERISDLGLEWHDFDARMYDPTLGRMHAVDPQLQFNSPYLAMGNNPVMMGDPDGEFVLPFLMLTDWGYDLQKYFSPIAIRVRLGIGSHETGAGIDASFGIPQYSLMSYRYEAGITKYKNRYMGLGEGWQVRTGGEWGALNGIVRYGGTRYRDYDNNWNILTDPAITSYSLIRDGHNQFDQTVHRVIVGGPVFNIMYENDTEHLFGKMPGLPHLPDGASNQRDRYRTAAGRVRAGGLELGFQLFTGQAQGGFPTRPSSLGTNAEMFDGGSIGNPNYSHGIIYFGAGPMKIGGDTEGIRHQLQNRLVHDQLWHWFGITSGTIGNGGYYPWIDPIATRDPRLFWQFGG